MERLKEITKWYISVIVLVVFGIFATIYFKSIKGLEVPAGIVEAIKFLITKPSDYFLCLFSGSIAKMAFTVAIIIGIVSIVYGIKDLCDGKYGYKEIEAKEIIQYIVNCIIAIAIGKIQRGIISYFWILVITIIIIFVGIKMWIDNY